MLVTEKNLRLFMFLKLDHKSGICDSIAWIPLQVVEWNFERKLAEKSLSRVKISTVIDLQQIESLPKGTTHPNQRSLVLVVTSEESVIRTLVRSPL